MADATTTTATKTVLESRIFALESRLGISTSKNANQLSSGGGGDISSRIDRLFLLISRASVPSSSTSKTKAFDALSSLERDWKESKKLAAELDPGSFLARQGLPTNDSAGAPASVSAPMIYRRQEILASSDFLKDGMEQLNLAREALLLSSDIEKVPLPPQERYTKSAILSSGRYDYAMDDSVQTRLEDVAIKIKSLQKRSVAASNKMDELVDRYHMVMEAVSEKIVLADEEIVFLEASAENKKSRKGRSSVGTR
mmetsp:Transcript_18183/g.24124  ORF Transcript_18183/g.24124 Transcript_18183/m.24124 type:complete len:255 (-) Transcript_18183:400-1164(-)